MERTDLFSQAFPKEDRHDTFGPTSRDIHSPLNRSITATMQRTGFPGLIRLDTVHRVTSISLGHSRYPSQETQDYSGMPITGERRLSFLSGLNNASVIPEMSLVLPASWPRPIDKYPQLVDRSIRSSPARYFYRVKLCVLNESDRGRGGLKDWKVILKFHRLECSTLKL